MPGIERLPLWFRLGQFWLAFALVMTVAICLLSGVPVTATRFAFVLSITAAWAAVERVRRAKAAP